MGKSKHKMQIVSKMGIRNLMKHLEHEHMRLIILHGLFGVFSSNDITADKNIGNNRHCLVNNVKLIQYDHRSFITRSVPPDILSLHRHYLP